MHHQPTAVHNTISATHLPCKSVRTPQLAHQAFSSPTIPEPPKWREGKLAAICLMDKPRDGPHSPIEGFFLGTF